MREEMIRMKEDYDIINQRFLDMKMQYERLEE